MSQERRPRTDLVEDDPFARAVRPASHSGVRDDGQWRNPSSGPRVVQVQFSPFTRGFTQSYYPPPTLHKGSFWHFSEIELYNQSISSEDMIFADKNGNLLKGDYVFLMNIYGVDEKVTVTNSQLIVG